MWGGGGEGGSWSFYLQRVIVLPRGSVVQHLRSRVLLLNLLGIRGDCAGLQFGLRCGVLAAEPAGELLCLFGTTCPASNTGDAAGWTCAQRWVGETRYR